MKKLLITVTVLLVIQLPWFAALIRCEIDTNRHGEELIEAFRGYSEFEWFVDNYDWAKVIKVYRGLCGGILHKRMGDRFIRKSDCI